MSDKSAQDTDASVATFVSSAVFTAAVSSALFIVFAIVRTRFPRVYAPKTYLGPERERPDLTSHKGIFGWVSGSRKLNDQDVIERCGLDAYMFLDFLAKSFFLFLGFTFLAIPILVPLNSINQLSLTGLNQFTIANIANQKRLWAHLILTVLFCGVTVALAILSVRRYITRRQQYLMSEHHSLSLQATTILVCGIPKGEDNLQTLQTIFSAFPGGIRRIWLAYSADALLKDVNKRLVLTNKLETAECALIRAKLKHQLKNGRRTSVVSHGSTAMLRQEGDHDQQQQRQQQNRLQQQGSVSDESFPEESRPHHRPAVFPMSLFAKCCGAEKVDSVLAYRSELSNLNASIQARQQAAMTAMYESQDKDKMSAAFIQFNHQLGAHLATQSVIHRKTLTMAPRHLEVHPKDVLWDNLGHSFRVRNIRRVIAIVLTIALILLWTIPVTFVAAVSKLESIVKFAPFLSGVYSLPKVVVGIIQGLLPPIGLAILMMVLPIILYKLAHLGGEVLSTRKTLAVITSYHWFSVVHVLLVTTLANGIFPAIDAVKQNPNNIMTMLSTSLPQASTFFLSFILLSFIQIPLMLMQIGPLIGYWIGKFLSSTPRQMYATERTMGSVDWGTTIPVHTIAFSIGLLYSTIQPFILPLMVIYFGLYYLAFRHMFLYVYRQPFDSGGLIFPRIIDQIYVAIILFEIVMLGLFVLQKAAGQSVIMFILLVASILAITISRNKVFKPLIQYLPVEAFDMRGVNQAICGNAADNASLAAIADGSYGSGGQSQGLCATKPQSIGTDQSSAPPVTATTTTTTGATTAPMPIITEKVNPVPRQESFHEKAPYKDPLSPTNLPPSKELYSPDPAKSISPALSGGHQRQGSTLSSRSHHSSQQQSPLPSIRVENANTENLNDEKQVQVAPTVSDPQNTQYNSPHPRQTSAESNAYSPQGSTAFHPVSSGTTPRTRMQQQGRQGSEYGGIGGSSSLQVLGANHSIMSSDPAAERVVPDAQSYVNPALWKQGLPIWLPKDPRGFAEVEIMELNNAGLPCLSDHAVMDSKGRVSVEASQRDVAPGDELWE
ncbi:hypothetical protein BGZ68_007993 [Mortierella alpina]|nr:hypothetical protein BGZ68_007993 [Mortierella alpina]